MNTNLQDPNSPVAMPESLSRQLGHFQRRLWSVETLMAVAGGAVGLLATYALLFVSDRLWETPMWARIGFSATGTLAAAWFAWFWTQRWVLKRRNNRDLARMVQEKFPRLGDRLLGTVELAEDETLPPDTSPALCRAAMQQVAREAAAMNFDQAVPTRRSRIYVLALAGLGAAVVAGWFLAPAAGRNTLQRWFKPWASIERYTFTRLHPLPENLIVPYGESFPLTARLHEESEWKPTVAEARFERQPPVRAPLRERAFNFEMPGQTKARLLTVAAGDTRQRMNVTPTYRPDLMELSVRVELPAYLKYPDQELDARNGSADVIEGSRVAVRGRASRTLTEASLLNGTEQALKIEGVSFASRLLTSTNVTALSLMWRDEFGLSPSAPFELKLHPKKDEPPFVDVRGLPRVAAILEEEVLSFDIAGEDDFGVSELGVSWVGEATAESATPLKRESVIARGQHQDRSLMASAKFSPLTERLGPQKVRLRAFAKDFQPDRPTQYSPEYVIQIMSRAEHADMIERRFEAIQTKLEALTRTEENLWDINKNLKEQDAKDMMSDKTTEQLKDQKAAEQENAEAMKRLSEESKEALKDAMRNPEVPTDVLKEWAKLAQTMQEIGEKDMAEVSESLQQAQQSQNAQQRSEKTEKATTKQNEILSKLKEALQKMNEAGEQLMAANFVNRLRLASQKESGISSGLVQLMPETVGLSADQLPAPVKKRIKSLSTEQADNQVRVRDIQDDMGHFLKRVTDKKYRTVHGKMKESEVVAALQALANLIESNRGARASDESRQWSVTLAEWADMLADKQDGGGGGGSGEQQELTPEQLEMLMKLMRIRQQEEGLREHTRYLEEHKALDKNYSDNARRLGYIQQGLEKELKSVSDRIAGPASVVKMLDQAMAAMAEAAALLEKPDTGGRTIGAETEVIELLGKSIEAGGSGSGGSGGSAAAMMMQMMMGVGNSPGGNPMGGLTDQANPAISGSATGQAGASRNVDKSGGRDTSNLPAEFREALQGFFNAVEAGVE